ncbi:MAG: type II toxin-antitoxin system VapC family toxin [Ignavibacteria bacterium]|nr:type II toxin-antitoxin system VapC family toxin [Ignavibacteria bacterium]
MKYLLDTNICIYIIKKNPIEVKERFKRMKVGDVAISNITIAELYYGVFKSKKVSVNLIALEEFLVPLQVLDFSKDDALEYGKVRADLELSGKVIGAMDMLIAAQALSRDLILVTNNEKEFTRINGLKVENWV